MEHAQLIVHRGGLRIAREALRALPTPAATATWKPLPHHVLVEALHEEAASRQITVIREEYAVQRQQHLLVGIMVLNWMATDEFAAALAFRHSNDMSEAVKLYAGVRVFACDNTAVAGDEIILRKKHSPRFDIWAERLLRYSPPFVSVSNGLLHTAVRLPSFSEQCKRRARWGSGWWWRHTGRRPWRWGDRWSASTSHHAAQHPPGPGT